MSNIPAMFSPQASGPSPAVILREMRENLETLDRKIGKKTLEVAQLRCTRKEMRRVVSTLRKQVSS